MIEKDLLGIEETIIDHHQDLRGMITEAPLLKKVENLKNRLDLKRSLITVRRRILKNFQKNLGSLILR
jgi:hypothetical protein